MRARRRVLTAGHLTLSKVSLLYRLDLLSQLMITRSSNSVLPVFPPALMVSTESEQDAIFCRSVEIQASTNLMYPLSHFSTV